MTENKIIINPEEAQKVLTKLWKQVNQVNCPFKKNDNISILMNCDSVSIKYCLPTQLLGKYIHPDIDCLTLQKSDPSSKGPWDPRSFCTKVLVPWVQENQNVLGSSTDPYVSKPLRKPRIEENPGHVKKSEMWKLLFKVLNDVQMRQDVEYTKNVLLSVLAEIRKMMKKLSFDYSIPNRVSLKQTLELIHKFLSEPSGGDRNLALASALFETFGEYFNLYDSVERRAINTTDVSSNSSGDIECLDSKGNIKISIEVKDRSVSLIDLNSAISKARKNSIAEYLFNAPNFEQTTSNDIQEKIEHTWASGTNIYLISIEDLANVGLALAGDKGRVYFLNRVGINLDSYNTQPSNRLAWKKLLETI